MPITPKEFDAVRGLVLRRSGIVLEPGKEYLVESRLLPVVRREGLGTISRLVELLAQATWGELHRKVVEAMTTNETSFFRDVHPFLALRNAVLPQLLARRSTTRCLNLWCAAASSGQEPYTIAMVLREAIPDLAAWRVNFLATDLSSEMIDRCREGRYSQLEVNRGLPAPMLVKYFRKCGSDWVVKDELRRMVDFRQMNLTEPWPSMAPMDVVLVRNVLIYFDVETKRRILAGARRQLRPDGFLFLGNAETTLNLDENYERVPLERSGCYRLRGAALAA